VAVGPPIDLLVYANDDLSVRRYRRLDAGDPELGDIRSSWEQALRHAIKTVPQIEFGAAPPPEQLGVALTRPAGSADGGALP
jgi:putative proteasome-type protease